MTVYSKSISDIIYDTEHYEVELLFYLTQHCNLQCPGCYMHASPNASRMLLPYSDLKFYLDEFEKIPSFTNAVTFSGGEIFTAPISYIEACSHIVLDRGLGLQLKTNGAWAQDSRRCNSVINMLERLQPQRGVIADEQQINNFFSRYPRWFFRMLGRDRARKWMYKKLPTTSLLSMVVSVDDKLHPAQSADWFAKIADSITTNKKLRDTVNLKTFTLSESIALLERQVLNNPKLKVQNFQKFPNKWAAKYTINGAQVESYVGEFVDTGSVPLVSKLSEITVHPVGDARGRLVYCFYPDGTVGFDCNYLESIGRVPYRNSAGQLKTLAQIQRDIHAKLVSDYARATQK